MSTATLDAQTSFCRADRLIRHGAKLPKQFSLFSRDNALTLLKNNLRLSITNGDPVNAEEYAGNLAEAEPLKYCQWFYTTAYSFHLKPVKPALLTD